jgi:hypothetical protein
MDSSPEVETVDDRLLEVARRHPTFGGAFIDAKIRLNVLTTRPVVSSKLRTLGRHVSQALDRPDLMRLEIVPGTARYSFGQLKEWHDRLSRKALSLPGVAFTDIDDVHNRLIIGAEKPGAIARAVDDTTTRLRIPNRSIEIVSGEPARLALRDRHRPVVGGLQFESFGLRGACTLGFVAWRAGVRGFVSASHCADGRAGGPSNFAVGQPDTCCIIGELTVDRPLFTGGECPSGRRCRYSDSMFGRFIDATSHLGWIAEVALQSIQWNGSNVFRIVAEQDFLLPGDMVAKVGRTTGRTRGPVTNSGIDINVVDTNITLLNQVTANYGNDLGDSGSPVFTDPFPAADDRRALVGLHWGYLIRNDGIFSPLILVQEPDRELGELATCVSSAGC